MAKKREVISNVVIGTVSAAEVTAGTLGLIFHIKELKDGKKSYDPLKDGVRDFSSGFLVGNGGFTLVTMAKDGVKSVWSKVKAKKAEKTKAPEETTVAEQ